METQVAVQEKVSLESLKKYLDLTGGANIPEKVRVPFLEIASAFQLNPFKREIYLVPYGNQHNIIVGYETYLKRAERSGQLDGWECHVEGEGDSMKAIIKVYRKDRKYPVIHEVLGKEFNSGLASWKKMPQFMLKKVAIAQAFRLAFPDDMAGLPFIEEEAITVNQNQIVDTTSQEMRDDQFDALALVDELSRENKIDSKLASTLVKKIVEGNPEIVKKAVEYMESFRKPKENEQA